MSDLTISALELARKVLRIEAAAILGLVDRVDADFERAVDLLFECRGRVIVTGMGKSGHVGLKVAATLSSTGSPAYFVHPSEASHGDLGMITAADAILALSNSGETPELADLLTYSRRFRITLVAIVGRVPSTLAGAADIVLRLPQRPEACPMGLAPTTSTTAMLALGDALAVALLERRGFSASDFAVFHPGGKLGSRLVRVEQIMHEGEELPLVRPDVTMGEAILEMTATNDEVAENMANLASSVRETVSSIEEMSYSAKEVAKNVDALSQTAEETSSSMNEMDVSIDQVQSNANETARLSEEVSRDAEIGAESIAKTIGEIISRIERRDLRIVAMDLRTLDSGTAKKHYEEHSERPFFDSLFEFINGGPLVAMVVEGERAVGRLGADQGVRAGDEPVEAEVGERLEVDLHLLGDPLQAHPVAGPDVRQGDEVGKLKVPRRVRRRERSGHSPGPRDDALPCGSICSWFGDDVGRAA